MNLMVSNSTKDASRNNIIPNPFGKKKNEMRGDKLWFAVESKYFESRWRRKVER